MTSTQRPQPSDNETELLIKIIEVQLKIRYPADALQFSPEIDGNGILKEAIKSFISVFLTRCDSGARSVMTGWLKLAENEIPHPLKAIKKLQHDHIMQELCSRGLTDYVLPKFNTNHDCSTIHKMPYDDKPPCLTIQGNTNQVLLITSPPILRPILSLESSANSYLGYCLHNTQIKTQIDARSTFAASCTSCPGLAPKYYQSKAKSFRFLIYNAKGAANPAFLTDLNFHSITNDIDFAIVRETKVPADRAKYIQKSTAFDRAEEIDPIGLFGGCWLLWNSDTVNFSILTKIGPELTASLTIIDKQ